MKETIICIKTPAERTYYRAIPVAKEFLDKDSNIINTSGTLPQGEVEAFDVTTKTVKHYKDGKLHGKREIIDLTTGEVTFSEMYEDGILTETTERTLIGRRSAKDGADNYEGTLIKSSKGTLSFYVNGTKVAEQTISPNGIIVDMLGTVPDGPAREYDENDQLRSEGNYQNNQLDGLLIRYDDQGRVLSRESFMAGHLQGPAEYYTYQAEGAIKSVAQYHQGFLDGTWQSFFPNGTVRSQAVYKNGKLEGERKTFYPDGKPYTAEIFRNGKRSGKRCLYFAQGALWYEENYENGRLQGPRDAYFQNGQKHISENYNDGLLDGRRLVFDAQGQLLADEHYHRGTLEHNTERKNA